jgi:cardiolipin synthase
MMIDDAFSTVGSANLNSRSFCYDYENNACIFDKGTTSELVNLFENDKKQSTLLTPEVWKKRSRWKRFAGWCIYFLTPIL